MSLFGWTAANGSIETALFHHVKKRCEYIRQSEDADDVLSAGHQEGLVIADHKLMNSLIQGGFL